MFFLKTVNNKLFNIINDPLEQFGVSQAFQFDKYDTIMPLSYKFNEAPYHFYKASKSVLSFYTQTYYNFINENVLDIFLNIWIFFVFFIVVIFVLGSLTNSQNNQTKDINLLSYFLDSIEQLVKIIVRSNTSLERQEWYMSLYFVFFFIFFCNMFGLLPYSFTLTSSFVVTFFIAGTHFLAINIIGIYKKGWDFFSLFLPAGVPIFIAPFLIIIEIVSYIAKVFSLSIRLFANMMSGHALLKILIGFSWAMLVKGGIFYGLSLIPWLIVTVIFFLELLIAFLQAYVFIVLLAIYINDVFAAH